MAVSFKYEVDGFEFMVNIGLMWEADGVALNPETYQPNKPGFLEALDKIIFLFPMMEEEVILYERSLQYTKPHHFHNLTKEELDFATNVYPCDMLYPHDEDIEAYMQLIYAEIERRRQYAQKQAAKQERLARKHPGYVYLVQSPTSAYKIGRTKDPKSRAKTFGVQLPFEIEFICLIQTSDMHGLERQLHERFAAKRVNGEWFELTLEDVDYMKGLVNV